MDDYKAAVTASMDQVDAMLRDHATELNRVALKSPPEWTDKDWKVALIALRLAAARGIYLKGEEVDGEESD
jgi:hypothetical protein